MLQQLYSNTKPAGTHHSRPSPQHDGELVSLFCSCFSFWEGRGGCLREYEQAKSRFIKCECGGWVNVAALLCVSIRLSGCKCSTLFSPALHSAVLGYVLLLYYGDVWPKRCAAPHHTAHTPNTLFQTPSAAFSFHLSNSYSSLPFSSFSVPPSLTVAYLFTHPYISLPYCIHHFAWTLWAFLWLCFPQKEHNIADNLLWMMHILCIITPHSGCTHARRGFTVRSRVSDINAQFK